ncbi:MAG TPA: lytic transglycosylase domain-containing protein [Anaeromyxobacteraceae bacterium]|nr:lytic transglycosylase domain-containing protein [Anaeromyxobacteraceae bacterium]
MARGPIQLSLLGLLAAGAFSASADELCAYKRHTAEDGDVWTFTNVGAGPHCKKKVKLQGEAGVYRASAPPAPAAGGAPATDGSVAAFDRPGLRELDAVFLDHVRRAAALYNLPEELLRAVMAVESNFNPIALSQKGAAGLMQLMPRTASEMYVFDVWSPEQNIYGGARYLRVLANQYQGDMVMMLAAYNAGPDAVRRAGGKVPDIPETRAYVKKVMALYERLKGRSGRG